jgi:putative nucleotidyltransferase with HDIG domain
MQADAMKDNVNVDVSKGRILLVDDDAEVRVTLADILEVEGYSVCQAESGEAALDIHEKDAFDVLLTDLHMPGIDGAELIRRIRKTDPDLPLVVITGYPSLRRAVDVIKLGATDFLSKPFEADTVFHVLRRALKERALALENRRLSAEVNNKAVIEKLNSELHRRVSELTKLNIISERLSHALDTEQIFDIAVSLTSELVESQRVSLMLYDRRRQSLRIRAATGMSDDIKDAAVIPLGEGVSGKVAESKQPVRVTREMAQCNASNRPRGMLYDSESWISVPLLIGNQLFGVLNATDNRRGNFTSEDERVLTALAEKVANKIETNALYESLYDNLLDTLDSLVATIEAKDPYTRQHSRRVSQLSRALGERMRLSREEVESLRVATLLHDIGKIGVRDSILMKNGRLTNEEYDIIKKHPVIGDQIVSPLGLAPCERDIIRHHHERIDGNGYPDGLKGDEISALARVVSVADAFDAMTSTRSYRKALSIDEALAELRRFSGEQFDQSIVEELAKGIHTGEIRVTSAAERLQATPSEMAV